MEKHEKDCYIKAGGIAKETQDYARKHLKEGINLFEFAEKAEDYIQKKGGFPAFPINLSQNNVAAHYTPSFESEDLVLEGSVIKVDIGVHVDGFIADSAFTIDFSGKHSKLVEASENALEAAAKMVKEKAVLGEIGEAIEEAIRANGSKSVENLSGHGVMAFDAHTFPTVPNVANNDPKELEDGMAIAIEPFSTNGEGFVRDGNQAEIFELNEKKPIRGLEARKLLEFIDENYKGLPFAERWVQRDLKMSNFARKVGMRELLAKKCIGAHPLLKEEEGAIVAQTETTFLLNEGKVIRLL